jgi:iron(III) transport system substrate-binding protein
MLKKALVLAVVLVALGAGLAGTAFAQAKTSAERFEALSKELYPKAQKEGALIVYSQADVEDIVRLTDGFSKQFPGIKVDYWQSESAQIVTRVLTEFRAGKASVDVLQHDIDALILRNAGATAPFESVQKKDLVVNDPSLAIIGMEVQAIAYNTKKLKAADLPKGWEDLPNPRYKGIMALDDPMRGGPLSIQLAILKGSWKSNTKWTKFLQGLKALNVPVHRSTGAMFRLLVAGEFSIAEPALLHDILREMEKGSPVDYVRAAPPVVFPDYLVLYAKAPHPNAARLFIEWVLSPTGQAAYSSTGRTPNLKGLEVPSSLEKAWSPKVKPISTLDPEFVQDQRKWLDTYVKPIWEAK